MVWGRSWQSRDSRLGLPTPDALMPRPCPRGLSWAGLPPKSNVLLFKEAFLDLPKGDSPSLEHKLRGAPGHLSLHRPSPSLERNECAQFHCKPFLSSRPPLFPTCNPAQVYRVQGARAHLTPTTHPSVLEAGLLISPLSSGAWARRFYPRIRPGHLVRTTWKLCKQSNTTAPLRFRVGSSGVRPGHLHFFKACGFSFNKY